MATLSEVLRERGYVYQHSTEKLEEITDGEQRTVYEGFDPSADSLHVGNLMGMLVLRRFLEAGHKVILLVGGGTGMIGDPSGKNAERVLLTAQQVSHNAAAIGAQAKKLFDSDNFTIVNNADWLEKLPLIDFLRDIGKSFSVNAMLQRDSVKGRLENQEQGISYTEFSYMLLQAYDFYYLNKEYGCDWQHGSSDQWGNILSGIDLIRRQEGKTAYATTHDLLINKSTGRKFGKTESGAVWLDPKKTSPFKFYQFWLNTEDDSVEEYLLKMTMLSKEEIDTVMEEHKKNPDRRKGQRILATAVTILVHGADNAAEAETASQALFGADSLVGLDDDTVAMLKEEAPSCAADSGNDILDLIVASGLASSKREARQFIEGGAITINGEKIAESRLLTDEDFIKGAVLMRRGKRHVALLTLQR